VRLRIHARERVTTGPRAFYRLPFPRATSIMCSVTSVSPSIKMGAPSASAANETGAIPNSAIFQRPEPLSCPWKVRPAACTVNVLPVPGPRPPGRDSAATIPFKGRRAFLVCSLL